MTPEQVQFLISCLQAVISGENDMKLNVLIAGCLALLILCTCAVAGVGAVELHAELDAAMDEWGDPEVALAVVADLAVVEGTENKGESESCLVADATLSKYDDPEITPTIPRETLKLSVDGSGDKESGDEIGSYKGVPAYSNGANTGTGDGKYQCVEYVKRFYKEAMKVDHNWKGDAVTYYTEAEEKGLIRYPNDNPVAPKPNDILVFGLSDSNGWGHVAIITEVGNDYVKIIEQNARRNDAYAKLTLEKDDLGNYSISGRKQPVEGWCRSEAVKTRDTILILDASGSMSGTPVVVMRDAAKIFCSEVLAASGENRVAIVVYSDKVEKTLDLTSDPGALNSTIDSIRAGGGTNIGAALDSANSLLSSSDADIKNIILMTDGLPEHGEEDGSGPYTSSDSYCYRQANYVYNKCSELKQKYNIYTLGFFHGLSGNNLRFGQKFLYDIQNKGYYNVTNADELKFIFGELVEDITKEDYPVIVVHGIMGGKLYDDNDLVWIVELENIPDTPGIMFWKWGEWWEATSEVIGDLSRLDIENDLDTPDSRINLNVEGVEREYGVLDSYKELVDGLCEQFPDRAVYFFSYDWRQSNDDSAVKLNDLINDVKTQTEYSKVDLVCHSMGGLVASSYAKQYGTNDVRYIITLATPYEGAPSAIIAPLDPVSMVPLELSWILRLAIEKTNIAENLLSELGLTKELIVGLPSISEITPTERYFESTEFLKTGESKQKAQGITYSEYCNIMRSIFGDDNYNSAATFQNSIEDVLLNLDNAYFAVATGSKTIAGIIINEKEPASLEAVKINGFDYTESGKKGDGTVPYMSATMNGSLLTKYENEKDSAGNSRYREFDTDHTGILSRDNALLWIKNILSQKSNPYEEFDKTNYRGYTVIRIACPIDVTIDVDGEILSSDLEMGLTYVSNGRLDFISDNGVSICLEDTGTPYDISITGSGEGTMDYDIDWYDSDDALTGACSFYEVPITTGTEITTNTDSTEPTVLNIDSDGDGVFDTQWSVDASGETVVIDLKPTYILYSDGGSDTSNFAVTSGSVSFGNSAGITGINFPDGVKGMVILNDPSPEITPPENTYALFDISAPPFEGSAEINFVIPSAILVDSGYNKTDVVMKHYTNNSWQNLPTYFVGEERGATSYMATTTSFSPFAIVYEVGGTVIADTGSSQKPSTPDETAVTPTANETQPAGEGTVATGEEQTAASSSEKTTSKAEAAATKSPAPVVGMLFALGAAVLLWRRA